MVGVLMVGRPNSCHGARHRFLGGALVRKAANVVKPWHPRFLSKLHLRR
jgi:hypothetical protein